MRLVTLLLLILTTLLPLRAAAQDLTPVITVNNKVITAFELSQRRALLELFRTPGNLSELARAQLIDDRLKQIALENAGVSITPETLASELEAFAGRANLSTDQFMTILRQNGIDRTTLEDFVEIGVAWRDYIRARYGRSVQISDSDINRAIAQAAGTSAPLEVLLSEIIIAAPPPQAAQAMARANQISQITSAEAFSAAAREVSALPSRVNGGRLDWVPLSNFPPQVQDLLLALSRNEVTAPLPIPNGVALFQMRGLREVPQGRPAPTAIDYAAFYLPSTDPEAAAQLALRVDTCDDLYGEARGLPPDRLERQSRAPADIPQDVALELARLDPGEVSWNLTRGDARVFLMLCSRSSAADGGAADREQVTNQLRSARLAGLADALLAELRAAATIRP